MTTWVLLRGLTRESRHWGTFPETFRRSFPEANVIALDLPGNGRLNRETSPSTIEAMSEHCRAQLLDRGLPPPYDLLAISLGAMVAVDWANRHGDELHCCVLINTSLRPFNPFHRRLRIRNYASLLRLSLPAGARQRELAVLRMTSRQSESTSDVLGLWVALARESPVSRGNALRQLLAAARYRAPRERPARPILLLASAADALVDPSCSRRIAARWQADLLEHPTAGHDLPLDDGPWVATQVRRWIDQLPP